MDNPSDPHTLDAASKARTVQLYFEGVSSFEIDATIWRADASGSDRNFMFAG